MRLAPVEVVRRTLTRVWARRGAIATRTLRLTGAAVAAYLAALLVLDDPRPVLAPLTALLVVQVTLVGTINDSLRRIASVVVGVAVAVGFSAFVGLAVNILFPPAVQSQSAGAAVEEYAKEVAGLLDQVAGSMHRPATREQIKTWLDEARYLTNQVPQVEAGLDELEASRRLNRHAIDTITSAPGLRSGLNALEHAALDLRALYRLLADVQLNPSSAGGLDDSDVRTAFATLLRDIATAIRDFGGLVRAEADDEGAAHPEELAAALDSAGEARARLTELLLVDPQTDPEQWQLTGALLTAADRALRELDLDERARLREARRRLLTGGEAIRAAVSTDRLLEATRSATHTVTDAVVDAVAEVPRRRAGHWVRGRDPD